MKIDKDNAMLINIIYNKGNYKENIPDYIYLIWRDLKTYKSHLEIIEKPKITIYFEKNEFRNHSYNKNTIEMEKTEPVTCEYNNIIQTILKDMGDAGNQFLKRIKNTGNWKELEKVHLYPYVFGSDYKCNDWYKIQWVRTMSNSVPKKLHKGFLDIETDGLGVKGIGSPIDCPVNAITVIDGWNKISYTFLLMYRDINTFHTNIIEPDTLKEYVNHMHKEQKEFEENEEEFKKELHEEFDEFYGEFEYKFYYYTDERKMLVHLFQMINKLKMDFIGIWNISYDIPFLIERMTNLGLDYRDIICHPDFPTKECYFVPDKINHDVKNKNDVFHCNSYTTYYDQMELYSFIRKGGSELRSVKLNYIAEKELKDKKLDYSEDGDIKTLPYTNFKKFVKYNIKDVLLQYGIERRTSDFDTLYSMAYSYATSYDKVFKQTVTIRNSQYLSLLDQGRIPGNNVNKYNIEKPELDLSMEYSNDTLNGDEDEDTFEGALVADPKYMDNVGIEIYGHPTNNLFNYGIDFDMGAFYPNTISATNIDPSTLIFKTIMSMKQFLKKDGLNFRSITKENFDKSSDGSKECIDNFQTGNYLTTSTKWLNLPDVYEVYNKLMGGDKDD